MVCNCSSSIYWKVCPLHWITFYLCWKSVVHRYVDLFLGWFCLIDVFVYFDTSTILSWLLMFYMKSWVLVLQLVLLFQYCFGWSKSFEFPYEFLSQFANFYKFLLGFWLRICWLHRSNCGNWLLNNVVSFNPWIQYISSFT